MTFYVITFAASEGTVLYLTEAYDLEDLFHL